MYGGFGGGGGSTRGLLKDCLRELLGIVAFCIDRKAWWSLFIVNLLDKSFLIGLINQL